MEPANILFVIAFIGLPVAFGIWALVSRRELKRGAPPRRSRPQQAPRRQTQTPTYDQEQVERSELQTMQAPAVGSEYPQHEDTGAQETVQVPAALQQAPQYGYTAEEESAQETVQVPAVGPETSQDEHEPYQEPAQETVPVPAAQPVAPQYGYTPQQDPEQGATEESDAGQYDSPTEEPAQETGEMPPVQLEPQPEPQPEPEHVPASPQLPPPPGASWRSGTTEEFVLVGFPEQTDPLDDRPPAMTQPAPPAPPPAPPPVPAPPPAPAAVPQPPPRRAASTTRLLVRRPFYAPRYSGRAGGVVKRLTPLEWQQFLAPKSQSRR